ncbi:Bikaverin cluster transcription factor [Trichophyton interdigitale]|nr:Bikaverin cluster transcription factor [Trichophyton interdigitale]KAG5217606.1 Bikaverin cluster transcription factor [Trichophyton interdigitale]KAG8206084.1 Bikaverin cluster transcription factor [Trichophyton interdigitale]
MDASSSRALPSVSAGQPALSGGIQKSRQRAIAACLTCRRRKVKCDHGQPICSPCLRGNRACSYVKSQSNLPTAASVTSTRSTNRVPRSNLRAGQDEIRNRLERLERLLERAISGGSNTTRSPDLHIGQGRGPQTPTNAGQNSATTDTKPANPKCETLSVDGYDGALLLEAEGGQSRWVSSLHYALLADEIHDVKMLLGDHVQGTSTESPSPLEQAIAPFPFSTEAPMDSLAPWAPKTAEECFALLDIFYSNVDPMTRILHKPSLRKRFLQYTLEIYGLNPQTSTDNGTTQTSYSAIHTFEPLALAIFYSAINSLSPEAVQARFATEKGPLLARFQRGVEYGLGRENFLITPRIEVLQAFVLLLTCQSREDDMSRTWTLLGLAMRIALSQGLHREPSLFPSNNMDVVQVEIRRRLWHQICYLDFRSAEGRGQEPTIADEDYTTLLPRNIDDDDLVEGDYLVAGTYSPPGFTDMTGHLIRLNGIHCFRRIIRSTYRLERRLKSLGINGNNDIDPITELQLLFIDIRNMVDEMTAHLQTQYLQYCDPNVANQRLALGLAAVIEWRCWSIFWLRTPKQYREAVVDPEIRKTVLTKSISLVESMNMMPDDKDAEKFQWHIGGHACFQAIMHIVSELGTPEFQNPTHHSLRSRALAVLKRTTDARGSEHSSTWNVINRIISNCLAKNAPNILSSTPSNDTYYLYQEPVDLPQSLQESRPVPENSGTQEVPLSSLFGMGSLDMQDPCLTFDWGFWNIDPTDPNSY